MEDRPAPPIAKRPRPLVLCILDGFGERWEIEANAIRLAKTPHLNAIAENYPKTLVGTSGPDVGLPPGQMGNSEVGHLNFGAGRIALMDIVRIDIAIAENKLASNEKIRLLFNIAKDRKCRLHLFGLVSDGGVHSSMDHLLALINAAHYEEIPVVVHAFLDGRDTSPRSAWKYLERLLYNLEGKGTIGTLSGRFYAMDRDQRWERVHQAYKAIVRGDAPSAGTAYEALMASYDAGKTDEFVEPIRIGDYEGIKGSFMADFAAKTPIWEWFGEEVGLGFNFRPDRMREISAMLMRRNLPPEVQEWLSDRGKAVYAFDEWSYLCMTEYEASLNLPVAFPKDDVTETFGEIIAAAGLTQLRCAETEKYAHVTYFFSGGREKPFHGEDRKLVPSPRDVATYDLKPQMSAMEVASEVAEAVRSGKYDFILVNFANPDMVGHTGNLEAAIHAVETIDAGIGLIAGAIKDAGGALIITSDHGNCELMRDDQGRPHTAHTTFPVPLYYMNDNDRDIALRGGARIADVAPTMLEILGLPKPQAMTGRSLRTAK
ncbi:MAG TPA: 2,3-bisphosphoglycerate-independent phosphoglycerate mutase [Polyangiaceae bacterium]|nr:2,3-bisphosphoglycerate-independent phosphoglycerate mutase [Polyangiaceae bacterium]